MNQNKYEIVDILKEDAYYDIKHLFIGKIINTDNPADNKGMFRGSALLVDTIVDVDGTSIWMPYFADIIVKEVN